MTHETFEEYWQREGIRFLHEGKAPTHEQQARHAWESRQEETFEKQAKKLQSAIDDLATKPASCGTRYSKLSVERHPLGKDSHSYQVLLRELRQLVP